MTGYYTATDPDLTRDEHAIQVGVKGERLNPVAHTFRAPWLPVLRDPFDTEMDALDTEKEAS